MKPTVECNICFKQGNSEWAGWHKECVGHNDFSLLYGDNDEPPSKYLLLLKSNQDSIKLCLSRSRDLRSLIFGCQPLLAGSGSFRSLVWAGYNR